MQDPLSKDKFFTKAGYSKSNYINVGTNPMHTTPVVDVLRVRPELWKELGLQLKKPGVELPISEQIPTMNNTRKQKNYKPVPLNKVGDYCDSNRRVPVEFKGQQMLAILDSGVGVFIATKIIWESWGKPCIRKMRMKL